MAFGSFTPKSYSNLVPQYVDLALKHDIFLLGYTVDTKAYKEYANKRIRNEFGTNAFASAASGCAHRIFDWLHWLPDEQCALVVDCKDEFAASITDTIYTEANKRERYPLLSLTTISHKNRMDHPMSQIGDLGANLTARHTAARHYQQRIENDLSERFFDAGGWHWLGITHVPPDNIEKMADIHTDPIWSKFLR